MDYLLGQNTRDRLMRLLGNQGAVAELRGGGYRPSPAPWVVVRCTSATAAGGDDVRDQCYPAVLLDASANEVAPLPELADCLLTLLGEDGESVAPTAGRCYAGVLTGDVSSDGQARPRVFAVEAEGGSAPASVYGQAVGTLPITITGSWTDLGASVTLPGAGTYEIDASAVVNGQVSAISSGVAPDVVGRIFNVTSGSEMDALPSPSGSALFEILCVPVLNIAVIGGGTYSGRVTVSGATTLRVDAIRGTTGTWTFCTAANYAATLAYRKID